MHYMYVALCNFQYTNNKGFRSFFPSLIFLLNLKIKICLSVLQDLVGIAIDMVLFLKESSKSLWVGVYII